MNPNPRALRILCYGDSNTWGARPDGNGRFPADTRWTGRLQTLLGEGVEIIEEGLGGRTTDTDWAGAPGRSGAAALAPLLESHQPLDGIVLALGTNDLKAEFQRSAENIARGVAKLVGIVRQISGTASGKPTRILIVCPPPIDERAERFNALYGSLFDARSRQESHRLCASLQTVAKQQGCALLNAGDVTKSGNDGVHLDAAGHHALAAAIADEFRRQQEPRGLLRLLHLLQGRTVSIPPPSRPQ